MNESWDDTEEGPANKQPRFEEEVNVQEDHHEDHHEDPPQEEGFENKDVNPNEEEPVEDTNPPAAEITQQYIYDYEETVAVKEEDHESENPPHESKFDGSKNEEEEHGTHGGGDANDHENGSINGSIDKSINDSIDDSNNGSGVNEDEEEEDDALRPQYPPPPPGYEHYPPPPPGYYPYPPHYPPHPHYGYPPPPPGYYPPPPGYYPPPGHPHHPPPQHPAPPGERDPSTGVRITFHHNCSCYFVLESSNINPILSVLLCVHSFNSCRTLSMEVLPHP